MSQNYRWPILVGIVGISLCAAALWIFIQGFGGWSTSFQMPGTATVDIPSAGDYRLWHASKGSIDGRLYVVDDELPAGSVVELADARGRSIALQAMQGSMSQEIGSTRWVALGRANIPEPGSYIVSVAGLDEPRLFSLSEIRFLDHFLRSLAFGLIGLLLAVSGLIWMIVIGARRRSAGS